MLTDKQKEQVKKLYYGSSFKKGAGKIAVELGLTKEFVQNYLREVDTEDNF
jgi:predicted transcriptional regulator